MKKSNAILITIVSAMASWLIANIGVDYDRIELGALMNMFVPVTIGAISVVLFALLDWALPRGRIAMTIIFCVINLLSGIAISTSCC